MTAPFYRDDSVTLHHGDALAIAATLESGSVDCIVTSPPYYGLRDYGVDGQYGLEESPAEYVATLRALFAELRRVLAVDGTVWLNLGDTYSGRADASAGLAGGRAHSDVLPGRVNTAAGIGMKQLLGIPWRVAFALQDDGWVLRNDIVWHKPNAMPESATDRMSRRHEHMFMLTRSRRYHFDPNPGGSNPGDVWTIATQPFPDAHFATMPLALAERCIQSGCRPGGVVLDPFSGTGTTGLAAARHDRRYVGIDLNREYLDLSIRTRLQEPTLDFGAAS